MDFDLTKLIRPNIKELNPYSSARDEFEGEASVFLDANENPYSDLYNRYPDPHQRKLKEKIASLKRVNEERIFIGNGSDEVIDLLFRAFCEPAVDEVLIPQPTYGMYSVSAAINNVSVRKVTLNSSFDIDLEATLKAITSKTKLIFLCSPNNPSGNLLSPDKIISLLKKFNGLVLVDEAYIDFTSSESFISKLTEFKNLVVLQTLSKAWGLASLRLGMCFASMEIISVLNKIKPPYNISGTTQAIALERLDHVETKNKQVNEILEQRRLLAKDLSNVKIVEHVYPSDANFILTRVTAAKQVYQKLIVKGIVVRDRSNVLLCNDCLRITVGTPNENKILFDELNKL
ncbi:MAG: histidinol-phosphate transaminase [Bacteroidetes bacterium]|nr:histidinol-phosphate transaminase [Bacteroidota bacterium]MBI3483179.1 histidinol-phosphate transaminase [Bacteroidota bacterium]